jgi:hypothetical protein
MSSLYKPVGKMRKQDKPVTIDVLREAGRILEGEWHRVNDTAVKHWVAEMPFWFVARFCQVSEVKRSC